MKKVTLTICLCVLLMTASASLSFAATYVVFDNFAASNTYNVNSYQDVTCGQYQGPWYRTFYAMAFEPDKTVSLDKIDLGLTLYAGYNNADVLLMADNGGLPGGTIESIRLTNVIPPYNGLLQPVVTATSALKPQLQGGTRYWIAIGPGPNQYVALYWHYNTVGYSGAAATAYTRDGTWFPWTARTSSCTFRVVGSYSGCARPRSDLNGDCKVNLADLAILASDWLECGFENPADC